MENHNNFDWNRYFDQIKSKPQEEWTEQEKANIQALNRAEKKKGQSILNEIRTRLEEKTKPLIAQRNLIRQQLKDSENKEQVKQMKANTKNLSDLNKKNKSFKENSKACKLYLDTSEKLKIVNATLKKLQSNMKKLGGKLVIHKKSTSSKSKKNNKRSREDEDSEDFESFTDAEKRPCLDDTVSLQFNTNCS